MKKAKSDLVKITYRDGSTEIIVVPPDKLIGPAVAEHIEESGGDLNKLVNFQIVGEQ